MNLVSGVRSTLGGIEENGKAHAVIFLSDKQGSRKSAMYIHKRKDLLKLLKKNKKSEKRKEKKKKTTTTYQDCLEMLGASLKNLHTVVKAI